MCLMYKVSVVGLFFFIVKASSWWILYFPVVNLVISLWCSVFSTEGVLTWLSNKLQASHQCFVKTTNGSFIKHRASHSGFSLIKFYQISISLNSLAVKQYYTRGPPECSKHIAVIRLEVKYEKVLLHPRVLCRVRELMCVCGLGKHCIMDSDRRK